MHIQEAVSTRKSVRDFLNTPVPREVIQRVLEVALRTPSGGNLQPWHLHVVGGHALADFKASMRQTVLAHPQGDGSDYDIYPRELVAPYRDRRFQIGEALYAQLGIPREDKAARVQWFQRNFEFFGAPLALFLTVDRRMGPPQWSDLGMVLQTIMLLLRGEGLHSCAQECWAIYPRAVESLLNLPAERMLFAGLSIGYAKEESAVNHIETMRAPLTEVVEFIGL